MSDKSRKVKNPLLSAAGINFPFEDFSGNGVLMPVTPATSSVLQDEGEIASFVGQPQPTPSPYSSDFNVGSTLVSENQIHRPLATQQQQQKQENVSTTSEIYLPPITEPPRDLTSEFQPQKQGYLSSLLSSLPNISLGSITGDREDSSGRSSVKERPSSSEYNLYPPHCPPGAYSTPSFNPGSGRPPIGHQENPYDTSGSGGTPANWNPSENLSRGTSSPFAQTSTIPLTSPPVVQPPPPALPPTGAPSSSYRLNSQRRLKYAPPPDLTSSSPRVNNLPPNVLPPQSTFLQGPSVLYPQQPVASQDAPLPPGLEPSPNYNRESVRFTPSLSTAQGSSPQSIPPRISVKERQLEPETPQNTPANPTPLSVSTPPAPDRGLGLTVNPTPRSIEGEVLQEVNLREPFPPAAVLAPSAPEVDFISKSQVHSSSFSSPFAPISATRVSEKLEHPLTESEEIFPKVVQAEVVDSGLGKSESKLPVQNIGADLVPSSTGNSEVNPPVTAEVLSENNNSGINLFPKTFPEENKKTTATYFAPSVDQSTSTPSFFGPSKFEEEVKSLAGISTPQTTSGISPFIPSTLPSEPKAEPTFYNPSQFSSNPNLQSQQPQLQSYSTLEKFAPVYNPQNYFYSPNNKTNTLASNVLGHQDPVSYFSPPSPPMAATVPEPTGSATLDPIQMSINPLSGCGHSNTLDNGLPNLPASLHNLASGTSARQMTYRPVYHHWFHRKEVETKVLWLPFSMQDSLNLEEVHNSTEITPETIVPTEGGRYDVDILRRLRTPVYWSGIPNEVRRCSWFYKGASESRYVPYEESIAARLEEEYQQACNTNIWNKRVDLSNGEYIIFHNATVQVHYLQPGSPEMSTSWGNNAGSEDSTYLQGVTTRPRVVKRGVDEFNIDEGEPEQVDHLLFLVHGIGSVCDLKFRSVEEVVDEFRSISLQLVESHYRTASEQGIVHKIEVLPISWHTTLHSEDTGIDKKLQAITLESIPKLRHFTNDTLSDILFYTSPVYCQTIMQTVGNEMNRLYALFKERNPTFEGGVYLGGHSLGSLILFDLLCHQKPPKEEEEEKEEGKEIVKKSEEEEGSSTVAESVNEDTIGPLKESKKPILKRRLSKKISYVMGAAGTGQPYINYPQLNFHPNAFFAFGSPIGMFVTVRGIDTLGQDFTLPTCPAFFNIFHPFDPVAYRVEALIHPEASKYRPKLIPHHKGRKRMHLELKETMARVGADLKQKLLDSVRSTWNSVYQLAMFHKSDNQTLELEIDKVVEEQLHSASSNEPETVQHQTDDSDDDIKIGKLNGGRRIDYVLQEAPFEYINEYIFALTSHVCYWESEDTMLMILKEIYGSSGIQSDAQLPQQTLTIERASPSPVMPRANTSAYSNSGSSYVVSGTSNKFDGKSQPVVMGMDPTAPISDKPVGPPPTSGFLRKS